MKGALSLTAADLARALRRLAEARVAERVSAADESETGSGTARKRAGNRRARRSRQGGSGRTA